MQYDDVVTHIKECQSIKPEDFLKEDAFSAPEFKNDQVTHKVRYEGPANTCPIRRSFVGSKEDFEGYHEILVKENGAKR